MAAVIALFPEGLGTSFALTWAVAVHLILVWRETKASPGPIEATDRL